ncbi:MAG: alpha/beta hydrolase [Rhodospirillaceae bacterium]|nr:alpha/beta hydrolase [Rhodospirillaceae bacterium]
MRIVLRCLIVALALPSLAHAQPVAYDAAPIDRPDAQGVLWIKAPPAEPRGVVVVLPGAQMTADRYTWLSEGLAADGFAVVIAEAALEWRTASSAQDKKLPARYAMIPHALAALDQARSRWPAAARANLIAIGHSLGGGVILDMLDSAEAARNPNTKAPKDFTGVTDLDKAVILGASLQASGGAVVLPNRSDTRVLRRPEGTQILMIAGENDGMATPAQMQKTAARYTPPLDVRVVAGANHLGWSAGRGPMDRPDLDKPATITDDEQNRRTLEIIRAFLAS